MKKVKLFVFGLVPAVVMFLVSCSVPSVRTVGKEQHTGVMYILELTKDSMVFKGEDGTIYEAEVTKDSRHILNHAAGYGYGYSLSLWGTLFYVETSSGWKALRFTPDPNREPQRASVIYQCGTNTCWDVGQPATEKKPAKKKK